MKQLLLLATLGLLMPQHASSQSIQASAEALKIIGEFAGQICQTVPLEGEANKFELSGKAKAELEGLIKKIANLGIEGAGKYESSSFKGVLQADLAKLVQDQNNCRLRVWDDLKGKFGIGVAQAPKSCRDASHGIERFAREFDVSRSSHYMGGGFDQTKWCNQVIAELRGEHPLGQFARKASSENSKNTCPPFNCPQYQYHCTVTVKTEPVFVEKVSSACR